MHCQVEERDAKISVWAQKPVKVVSSVVIGKDSVAHETRYNIMQPVGIFPWVNETWITQNLDGHPSFVYDLGYIFVIYGDFYMW